MNVPLRYRTSLAMSLITATRLTILLKAIGDNTPAAVWRYVTSGLDWYRKGIIQSGYYVINYSPDGGTTWGIDLISIVPTEDVIEITIDDAPVGYRDLVRNGFYVIDYELTLLGFAGVENVDWINIVQK